jgi:hypothetical protein
MNSFAISTTTSWGADPISFEGGDVLGDLFEESSFVFADTAGLRGSFDSVVLAANAAAASKRKLGAKAEPEEPNQKRIKTKLGGAPASLAHVIEASTEADGALLMDEAELLALSDALTDSSDSFGEEESGFDEDSNSGESDDEEDFYDVGAGGEEGGCGSKGKKGGKSGKKARGNYACSKCGQAKRGHVCVFQPRLRRRAAAAAAVSVPEDAAAATTAAGVPTPRVLQQQRLAKVASAPPAAAAARVDAGTGASKEYSFAATAAPKMTSTASQCELEPAAAVRELYLDAQGFPESYAHGILADPTFCVAAARTVTVRRAAPKAYRPRATASSGSGPDMASSAAAAAAAALAMPFSTGLGMGMGPSAFHYGLPPLDPLSLFRGPLGGGGVAGGAAPGLTLNHLALLFSSFQHSIAQNMPPPAGEIDPALSALFFPMAGMPQLSARREA